MKPLVYIKRVHVPLEEQFRYLSDDSDSSDEEWNEGPAKKKDKSEPPSAGTEYILLSFFKNLMVDKDIFHFRHITASLRL